MDLHQLRTFLAVAATGSLSQAARQLHIVQPALSRQIRLLEDEVGSPLFVRHARGMRLTDAGELLSEHARRALRELDQARTEIASLAGEVSGHVVLGMLPSVGGTVAARFTSRLRRECPRVALRVVSGGGGYLLKWLESQEIDLAVVYEPSAPSHLDIRPLLEEPLHLIGPAAAALPASVTMAMLADLPLVLPSAQHALRLLIDRAAAAAGVALSVIVEADSMEMQKELVGAGIGWTVLPAAALGHDPDVVWFSVREIAAPYLVRRLALALPLRPKRPRAVDIAAEILVREVHELVGDNRWPGARLFAAPAAGRKA